MAKAETKTETSPIDDILTLSGEQFDGASDSLQIQQVGRANWQRLVEHGATDADFKKLDTQMMRAQHRLEVVNEQSQSQRLYYRGHCLQPTPPVGLTVVYLQKKNRKNAIAAVVVRVEGTGKVELQLHLPGDKQAMPRIASAVLHCSNPLLDNPHQQQTMETGSWDYLRGEIPAEDYERAKAEIARKEENTRKAMIANVQAAKDFQEAQAALEQQARETLQTA